MSNLDVIRAWKDQHYRLSPSEPQLARLPANPAGLVELSDDHLTAQTSTIIICGTLPICDETLMMSCITVCQTFLDSCITVCPIEELDATQLN